MTDTIKYRFRCRRRTASNWTTINEILLAQEIGLESDTGLGKVGDGITPWNSLLYTIVGQVNLTGIADGKCLAWDATNGVWKIANRGAVYIAGDGISIDSANPESPVISSNLGSLSADGFVDTYADLPSPPPSGKTTFYVEDSSLFYIWNGSSWMDEDKGISLGEENLGIQTGWDPSNKMAGTTIDSSGLIVTATASGVTAYLNNPRNTGKFYMEFVYVARTSSEAASVGFDYSSLSIANVAFGSRLSSYGSQIYGSGSNTRAIAANNAIVQSNTGYSSPVGQIVRIAIDIDAGKAWMSYFGNGGVWIGGGDPGSGTLPTTTFTPGTTIQVGANMVYSGIQIRVQYVDQTVYKYPKKFKAWT